MSKVLALKILIVYNHWINISLANYTVFKTYKIFLILRKDAFKNKKKIIFIFICLTEKQISQNILEKVILCL